MHGRLPVMSRQFLRTRDRGNPDQLMPLESDGSMAHLTTDPSQQARWVSIYPRYLDANFTVAEGRKVPKDIAIDSPNPKEILLVLESNKCNLECGLEQKMYSRDGSQTMPYRLRAKLFEAIPEPPFKKPINPAIASKKALLRFIAKAIPNLEMRIEYEKHKKEMKEQEEAKAIEDAKAEAKAKADAGQQANKGKKKKGKR